MLDLFINLSQLSPALSAIIFFTLGPYLLALNPKNKINKLFFVLCLNIGLWAFFCFLQSIPPFYPYALLIDKLLYSCAVYSPVILLQFSDSIIKKKRFNGFYPITYFISTIFLILNWSPFFRTGVSFNFGARFVTKASFGWYGYVLYYLIIIVIVLRGIYSSRVRDLDNSHKINTRALFASVFFLVMAGNAYFILILQKFNPFIDSLLNLISSGFLIVYNMILSIDIIKNELLETKLIITRLFSFIILLLFVLSSTFGIAYGFRHQPLLNILLLSISVFIWAMWGEKFRNKIQTSAEKKWIKGQYDSDKALNQLIKILSPVYSQEDAIECVVKFIQDTVEIKTVGFIANPENDSKIAYIYKFAFNKNIERQEIADVTILSHIEQKIVTIDKLAPMLHKFLVSLGYRKTTIIVPFISPKGLDGYLLVGDKISEANFSKKDLQFFETIQNQMQIVLDRIRPYEQIKVEYERFQKHNELLVRQQTASLLSMGIAHEIKKFAFIR